MNVSNLSTGMVVKNYKELCDLIGDKVKNGTAKIAQLKELKRYVGYLKKGNKFVILDVYKVLKKKVDNRGEGNNSIYLPHFELILLDFMAKKLSDNTNTKFELTTKDILAITGICNSNYIYRNPFDSEDVTNFDINDFFRRTGFKFSRLVESMLSNLKNRCIVNVNKTYIIEENNETRTATKKEEDYIVEAKREILNLMGYTGMRQVFNKFKGKEFFELLNAYLKEEYNWSCWMVHQISFSNKNILKNIQIYRKEVEEVIKNKIEMNDKVVVSIDKQAEDNYNKNLIDLQNNEWGYGQFVLNNGYVDAQKELCKYYIRI